MSRSCWTCGTHQRCRTPPPTSPPARGSSAAFGLLLLQPIALTLASDLVATTAWYYMVRLLAFGLIGIAIIDKNRSS